VLPFNEQVLHSALSKGLGLRILLAKLYASKKQHLPNDIALLGLIQGSAKLKNDLCRIIVGEA